MVNLTFEEFSSIIESIRLQFHKDKEYALNLSIALNIDSCNVSLYDNSLLVKSLLSLLQLQFPKKDSFCEIEHYMFEMNFGKNGNDELITVEDLWYQLNKDNFPDAVAEYTNREDVCFHAKNVLTSTHPLIGDDKTE